VIPLHEIIAQELQCGAGAKKVTSRYMGLVSELGSELSILLDVPLEAIESAGSARLRSAIERMRGGMAEIAPGYDGEYGDIRLFEDDIHE